MRRSKTSGRSGSLERGKATAGGEQYSVTHLALGLLGQPRRAGVRKSEGGAVVMSHGIALGGENLGEDKCPRGARPASGAKPTLVGTDS